MGNKEARFLESAATNGGVFKDKRGNLIVIIASVVTFTAYRKGLSTKDSCLNQPSDIASVLYFCLKLTLISVRSV